MPRALVAGFALVLALGAAGCGGSAEGAAVAAPAGTPADETTGRIAAVEVERQCTIAATAFPDEAAITTDLEDRLSAAGLRYAQWKDWHDALVDSPELVEQFAALDAEGCPGS